MGAVVLVSLLGYLGVQIAYRVGYDRACADARAVFL